MLVKIWAKVIISAIIGIILTISCTVIIVRTLLIDNLINEEKNIIIHDYQRTKQILEKEETNLANTQQDWALWDDAYQFIEDRNDDFLAANIQVESLYALKLNFILFADNEFHNTASIIDGLNVESEEAFVGHVLEQVQEKRFFQNSNEEKLITGLTILDGNLMLMALSPISTTEGTAPDNGYLIIGRTVTLEFTGYLGDILQRDITLAVPMERELFFDEKEGWISLSEEGTEIKAISDGYTMKSYFSVDDILNDTSILIEVKGDREIYSNGIQTINTFVITFLLLMGLIVIICIFAFNKMVIKRINHLDKMVNAITVTGDTKQRIHFNGTDEIARLAANTNNMLVKIDDTYAELRKREERFRKIMEATNDGYFDADMKSNKIYIGEAWLDYLGYDINHETIDYHRCVEIAFPEDRELLQSAVEQYMKGETEHLRVEYRVVKKNGEWIWILIRGRIVEVDEKGTALRIIGTISDISEQKLFEEKNKQLMQTDTTTSLVNRAYMETILNAASQCSTCSGWIIMGDVNGLKLVNDSFGHQEGDKLLRAIGDILRRCCSENAIPARWGGDEFLILVKNSDAESVDKLIREIKSECEDKVLYPFNVSISMGSATKDEKHQTLDSVLKLAEERMYRNKLLESRSTRSAIISSLEQSLHEKHIETEEHTRRIQKMCIKLGKSLDLSQDELDELILLGVLHDIGKIAIPESVLKKPGKLTDYEWEVMKTHSEIGYRIAASTPELAHVADEILCHHERYDGKGYPQGLAGKNIPKLSRLLSVADSFDVMTHDRVYKKAMSIEDAAQELKNCSGTQFDPEMVEVFLKLLEEQTLDL